MTTAKKTKKSVTQETPTLNIKDDKNKNENRKLAEVKLSPTVSNLLATQSFVKPIMGEIDLTEAMAVMSEKSEKIIAGDLSELESSLAAQVVSLNAIFVTLARRSASCEFLNQMEANLKLALKAQAQCARTVEVLSTMKNPPLVYAQQANIASGHQQINNGNQVEHAQKTKNSLNELISEDNNATMDAGGKIKTGKTDQELATLETINRSKK